MNEAIKISVVMPALDEEKNILAAITNTLKAFDDFSINGEIIVINDGSTDKTEVIVKETKSNDHRIRLIRHTNPKGIGSSFWDGVDIAKGNAVCMLPGDNENDPWEIFRYHILLEHVDIVIPFMFNKEVRSLFRNVLSYIYRSIINSSFAINLNYTNGTVLYKKSLLEKLTSRVSGFFYQTDILIRLIKKGYLFAEVPYRIGMREGLSKAVSFPSFLKVVKGYLCLLRDLRFSVNAGKNEGEFLSDTMTAKRHRN